MHATRTAGGHWRASVVEVERLLVGSSAMSDAAVESSLAQALAHLLAAEAGALDGELRRLAHRAVLATERAAACAAQLGGG